MTLEQRREWGKITLASSELQAPSTATYGVGSLEKLFDTLQPPMGWMKTFTSNMHSEYFLLYATLIVWLTVVVAGFGSEVVLGVHIIKNHRVGEQQWLGTAWHAAQLYFSLFLTVALFTHSALGLPFLVAGLWKMGFPETVCSFLASYRAFTNGQFVKGTCSLLDGVGLVLHHSTTAFVIVSLTTGLFLPTQQILACCVVVAVQHWFVLLRYRSKTLYIVIEVALEVVFELEVFTYVPYFTTPWGPFFDHLGRGCALTMLLSH